VGSYPKLLPMRLDSLPPFFLSGGLLLFCWRSSFACTIPNYCLHFVVGGLLLHFVFGDLVAARLGTLPHFTLTATPRLLPGCNLPLSSTKRFLSAPFLLSSGFHPVGLVLHQLPEHFRPVLLGLHPVGLVLH
jgi:hypothetical protein